MHLMKLPSIEQLNQAFAIHEGKHRLQFKNGQGDIPIIEIENAQARAVISLQGAHLLSWVPVGCDDVIWLSDEAKFAPGKSVRGGIPVCWPWFGAHETNASYPAHGFARTVPWQVKATQALSADETQITFALDTTTLDENYQAMWSAPTVAEYCLTIGRDLLLELTTHNCGDYAVIISQALHTYFKVADVSTTQVLGLEGSDYLDKTDDFKRKTQNGPVTIAGEVDRVYVETTDDVIIDDQQRKIKIQKHGSDSTVVWNPWQVVAAKMGDLGTDGYLHMLCVESANAMEDSVLINAGTQHTLQVRYTLEK